MITVLSEMASHYVQLPSEYEVQIFSCHVQRLTGFPGVIGAIDGTFIPLYSAPREEGQRYVNRHHDHAIVMQAVVDPTLTFRDVYAGEPGSLHDSRIFRRSPLSKRLLEDDNFVQIENHILGDGAYILTNKVLTPFRNNGRLTPQQLNYNVRHASARSMVERAFGLLKGKWRRLILLSSVNVELAVRNVVASVMLHNFVLNEGGYLDDDWDVVPHPPMEAEENFGLDPGDLDDPGVDHPNVQIERDHPLLAAARVRGTEKRLHIMGLLPLDV